MSTYKTLIFASIAVPSILSNYIEKDAETHVEMLARSTANGRLETHLVVPTMPRFNQHSVTL